MEAPGESKAVKTIGPACDALNPPRHLVQLRIQVGADFIQSCTSHIKLHYFYPIATWLRVACSSSPTDCAMGRSRSRSRSRERKRRSRSRSRSRDRHRRRRSRSRSRDRYRHDRRAERGREELREERPPAPPVVAEAPTQAADSTAPKDKAAERLAKLQAWKAQKQQAEAATPLDTATLTAASAASAAAPAAQDVLQRARMQAAQLAAAAGVPAQPAAAPQHAQHEGEAVDHDDDEVDPLDAFMAAEVMPEVAAKEEAERVRAAEEKQKLQELLAVSGGSVCMLLGALGGGGAFYGGEGRARGRKRACA